MREEDLLLEPVDDDGSPFSGFLRRRRSRRPIVILAVLALIAIAAVAWYALRARDDGTITPVNAAGDPGGQASPSTFQTDGSLELPAVDTSDAFLRRLIAGLSAHPQFAEWLVTDELARRFVTGVAALADGSSPTSQLDFMAPPGPFRVRESTGDLVVDPTSYLRYDGIVETFASLDTQGTARLIRRISPLLEQAHQELGLVNRTFRSDLERAIANLLAVDVPERPPLVVRGEDSWEYADPELENRSPAAKHLMRMGPENAARVQAKLAELAGALDLQVQPPAG